jgi:nucleoside 2-deoxyribosyltransferase
MSDWTEGLSDEDRAEWDHFVAHQREYTLKAMDSSAYVVSLVPSADKMDVKFAVELGFAIMLSKPVIAMAMPGTPVPYGLRKVADAVIVADLDTEAGREHAARQLKAVMAWAEKPGR